MRTALRRCWSRRIGGHQIDLCGPMSLMRQRLLAVRPLGARNGFLVGELADHDGNIGQGGKYRGPPQVTDAACYLLIPLIKILPPACLHCILGGVPRKIGVRFHALNSLTRIIFIDEIAICGAMFHGIDMPITFKHRTNLETQFATRYISQTIET
jgi:hypothetical protein